MTRLPARLLALIVLIGLLAPQPAVLAATASGPALQPACNGSLYRVQQGDSWSRLAQRTALSVAALKAANPAAAQHPQGWLIVGQLLCVPAGAANPVAAPQPTQPAGEWIITVRRGDSWAVLAARYGVSVAALQAANPQAVRPGEVLRTGDQIRVPLTPGLTERIACPADLTVLGPAAAQVLSEFAGSPEVLRSYLQRCGAWSPDWGAVRSADLLGDETPEVVVVAAEPQQAAGGPLGTVLILSSAPLGWEVVYETGVASDIVLLEAADANEDGRPDVVWTDTTCGANACFTSAHVISYMDGGFVNWIEDGTTMASAKVALQDVTPEGSGQELVMSGGVIGTVQAGPQRAVTTTWASLAGAPYTLLQVEHAPSWCLYHAIEDADAALAEGRYEVAAAAYRAAADDARLVACWRRPNEVDELRAYALYRLAVASAYSGDRAGAEQAVADLEARYPNDRLRDMARIWWIVFRATGDKSAACATARSFAERRPETWERLADYGYANPQMTAETICPAD
ncbi:MAG: LysM peptidoglycan-binding domain-containing protein [Caldilineales bacterium]